MKSPQAGPGPAGLDEALVIGGTLGYGVLMHCAIPAAWQLPANLAAGLASVALARRAGATAADCGIELSQLRPGLRAGGIAAATAACGVAALALPRPTRPMFHDERISAQPPERAVYELLARIPVATALSEELLFRGAMLGLLARRHGERDAIARTSAWFGLWHVLPTLAATRTARLGRQLRAQAGPLPAVLGAAVVTAVAGSGFAALRLRSRSLLAPVLAHAALNAAAYLATRRIGASQPGGSPAGATSASARRPCGDGLAAGPVQRPDASP
jgi:uncharacterized protein